jgi:hypothetical protein
MTAKLIHIPTGDIFVWQEHLAARPDMEEFIEGESEVVVEEAPKPAPKKKAAPKPAVELSAEDAVAAELGLDD